ncbi:hypothetical protein [Geodermatophilus poikilotrophus]|uniref:hypothetical protein n=1 Tax=Geodermatophilus poikilotrophus TaxID=1333667 RepID=UPI000B854833|nr:hypothetical protein [Geodermatophilus poikilotrophus]
MLFMPALTDVLDDDGIPDPEKFAHRAEQLAEWKPGLRKGARVPIPTSDRATGRRSTRATALLAEPSCGAVSEGWARDACVDWAARRSGPFRPRSITVPAMTGLWRSTQQPNWLFAVVGVGGAVLGGVLGAIATAVVSDDSDGPAPVEPRAPEVEITSYGQNRETPVVEGGMVSLSGQVSDLGPGQTVWPFDRHAGNSDLYAHSGPCPVAENGRWTCAPFGIGEDTDPAGTEFIVFAAVVDDADVPELVATEVERSHGDFLPVDAKGEPRSIVHHSVKVKRG